jgi:pimeloyl-ACP methyl ester carboxylesterase
MKKLVLFFAAVAVLTACSPAAVEIRSKGVVLKDNTVVHYLEAGQGPVLVLVHGLGASAESWRDSIRYLARGYRVVALDLPGYGKSDKPRSNYSIEYHAAALNDFIDALGRDKVALVGNSMGGWIAAMVALKNPEKISHLILVDSAGLRRDAAASPINLNPATKEEMRALLLALFSNKSLVTEKLVNDQWEYRKDIRSTVQATLESFKAKLPLLDERLKDIKIPTLIIWGRDDALIPLEYAEKFAKGIPGSKLVVIDSAGHIPQVEKPAVFYRAIKGFVRSW